MPETVLLVDDDPDRAALFEATAAAAGWALDRVGSSEEALSWLEERDAEAVVAQLQQPGRPGLDLCQVLTVRRPGLPVVLLAPGGTVTEAVDALRAGAADLVLEPDFVQPLQQALERVLSRSRLQQEVRALRRRVRFASRFQELQGESSPMRALYTLLERIADTRATVLLRGESGTGKELVARALHQRSSRKNGPFVAINCAAVPEPLLESELFGHVKGAFTDARAPRPGLFAEARGGTLFLDEIGDMPMGLQPKLLRALQERKVRPVGSDREVDIDVRLVAATHRDLEASVADGSFRQDLLYRLDVISVDLPPLRERGSDVLLLAQAFLEATARRQGEAVSRLSPEAARKLLDYDWPGNVRELQNALERAAILSRDGVIQVEDLPPRIQRHEPQVHVLAVPTEPSAVLPLSEVERRYTLQVLAGVGGARSKAARVLGIDRKTLYRKLKEWGVAEEGPTPPPSESSPTR